MLLNVSSLLCELCFPQTQNSGNTPPPKSPNKLHKASLSNVVGETSNITHIRVQGAIWHRRSTANKAAYNPSSSPSFPFVGMLVTWVGGGGIEKKRRQQWYSIWRENLLVFPVVCPCLCDARFQQRERDGKRGECTFWP